MLNFEFSWNARTTTLVSCRSVSKLRSRLKIDDNFWNVQKKEVYARKVSSLTGTTFSHNCLQTKLKFIISEINLSVSDTSGDTRNCDVLTRSTAAAAVENANLQEMRNNLNRYSALRYRQQFDLWIFSC